MCIREGEESHASVLIMGGCLRVGEHCVQVKNYASAANKKIRQALVQSQRRSETAEGSRPAVSLIRKLCCIVNQ